MKARGLPVLAAASTVAAAGLVAVGVAVTLPWLEPQFHVPAAIRVLMAVAGSAILIGTASAARGVRPDGVPATAPTTAVRVAGVLLGLTVLAYPILLSLSAANLGGEAVAVAATLGHVPPLVLVQLLPVLASSAATGRRGPARPGIVLGVAALGVTASAIGSTDAVGWASDLGGLLWLASFALAPVICWTGVTGTTGERRRRAITAALASVLPVVIIAFCLTLGGAAETGGLSDEASVAALMVGFSLATAGTAALALAAVGDERSPLLRRRMVVVLLGALLTSAVVLLALAASLTALAAQADAVAAVLLAVGVLTLAGLAGVRLFRWAARSVDPASELADEVNALGEVATGEQRRSVEQVLRRAVADPELRLLVRAADGTWLDADDRELPGPQSSGLVLAHGIDGATAVAVPAAAGSGVRLARLGDCSGLLRAAILEASVARETARADAAAAAERARLSQDLHDGLQGRLLGIALNLQLSGRDADDPSIRLLIEQAVEQLRDAVADVRSMAGGRLPDTLVEGGLRTALAALVRPLATLVELDVPDTRFDPAVEATCYFVAGEAVGNALKHGRAGHVLVRVRTEQGTVTVEVSDDGVGGADPRLGSGLRGLGERVAASGGVLVVRDGVPGGTVVEASLPCGS